MIYREFSTHGSEQLFLQELASISCRPTSGSGSIPISSAEFLNFRESTIEACSLAGGYQCANCSPIVDNRDILIAARRLTETLDCIEVL